MKLILAIVHNDDGPMVTAQLNKAGLHTTKIATTGGFLSSGNTTFITGVEDERVNETIDIIKGYSKKRTQPVVPDMTSIHSGVPGSAANTNAKVLVGGATIFVLNVESFTQV